MDFINFLRIFFITLLLVHQSKGESSIDVSSSVIFIDSPTHQYLRQNIQTNSISVKEVGAAISVLLGLTPVDLSPASSTKLNEVLLPNPFDRPRHVVMFQIPIAQDSQATVYASSAIFKSGIKSKVIGSEGGAEIELPDKEGAAFFLLTTPFDRLISDKDISDFATSISGNFESMNGELVIPLPSGSKLSLHMSKEADKKFVIDLIYMTENMNRALAMTQHSSESNSDTAELMGGYFNGIMALQKEYGSEDIVQQGLELLLTIVSRFFNSLQAANKGEAVAVLLFGESNSPYPLNMLHVTSPSLPTRRYLEEGKPSLNSTIVEEVILVRLTVAWVTGIILLIAVYIGAYLLLYMPVTKDTLLYSNVKLD